MSGSGIDSFSGFYTPIQFPVLRHSLTPELRLWANGASRQGFSKVA
jgi:hypothetical protein